MNPVQEVVAVLVLVALSLVGAGCASTRPPSPAPARPWTTWRCVLQDHRGERTVRIVERVQLPAVITIAACDSGAREASSAGGVCVGRDYRFASLDLDSMTATFRSVRP